MNNRRMALIVALMLVTSCVREQVPSPPSDRHQPYNFIARHGMVVAAHPLAAEAGVEILQQGGNAVDAAVATAFALNAAEPFASGIGGGGFMVIYLAHQDLVTVVNYREKAPSKAAPGMFIQDGEVMAQWKKTHGLAVAVPGALSGWNYALNKYGTKTLAEVTQGAIRIAEQGFEVSATFIKINKDNYEKLLLNAGESSCYLNQGFPYEPGDTFRNPQLGAFFKTIASRGIEEFYRGETAGKIADAVQAKGGILTRADLANYQPVEQSPLKGTYKDFTLFTTSPPSCGGLHMIQLLNIIESWPIKEWGHNSLPYIHHLSEAFRFVFADKSRYLGDPNFASIPVAELTSKAYARRIAANISPDHPAEFYAYGVFDDTETDSESTTHLCVMDREGNIVALTQSINHFFGSGIVPEGTGFLLNNHMDDFSAYPDSPNCPEPAKRPVSNMGPLILFQQDHPLLILGSPGGTRIFPSLTQIILNITEFGLSLDEAIEAPRFFSYSVQGRARNISLESRIPAGIVKELERLGHAVTVRDPYDKYFGGAQGLMMNRRKNILLGGADSRRDGSAAGY